MMPEIDEMLITEPPSRAVCFLISRDAVLAAEEHAVEVDRVHLAPFLERDVLDRLAEADAGGIEQHVQGAELVDRLLDRGLPVVLAGDVELHEMAGRAQPVGDRLAAVGGDVGHHHAGAFLRHQFGGVGAEARGAAGDQRDLALQAIGHFFFPPATASRWAMVLVAATMMAAPTNVQRSEVLPQTATSIKAAQTMPM